MYMHKAEEIVCAMYIYVCVTSGKPTEVSVWRILLSYLVLVPPPSLH